MSKIIEILTHEHEEILKFVDKLRNMCLDFVKYDKIDTAEVYKAVNFIKTYADERHHQKEEELLFKAELNNDLKVRLRYLEPFWGDSPWTKALKDKKM